MNKPTIFGYLSDGRAVTEYTLANDFGFSAKILDYGGIVRTLQVPDRNGRLDDVVLGFDEIARYEGAHPYFGAIVGRVAGRIGNSLIQIDGVDYQLPANDPPNHLHGGNSGFDHKLWDANVSKSGQSLTLNYVSPDGEEGYPGKLVAIVTYSVTAANELVVDYRATTDRKTPVNLTQHSYFNLSGDHGQSVLDHFLTVPADQILELDELSIPTGRSLNVENSNYDFRTRRQLHQQISDVEAPWEPENAYDNFWVLPDDRERAAPRVAAELHHEASGRLMQVRTTAPGVQIYAGNGLPDNLAGNGGVSMGRNSGICFEAQVHPDAPNHAEFPDILLGADGALRSTTIFQFLCVDK